MSELEDKINGILGDPAQMEKIAGLAKSLMGGGDSGDAPAEKTKSAGGGLDSLMQSLSGSDGAIDPAMLAPKPRAFIGRRRKEAGARTAGGDEAIPVRKAQEQDG